jgi:phosphoglycolate phosphatase
MKYKGIIFDLDSTLVQSKVDFVKMKTNMIKTLEENGHPKDTLSPFNQTTVQIMEAAEDEWEKQGKSEKIREILRQHMEEIMDQGEIESVDNLVEIEGASEAINELRRNGYQLAILTRGHHAYALKALEKTSMIDNFELILGRGETPKPKPYKEALDYTAKLMKLSINEILFVGDHQIDWDSAKNSGCSFIGVATGRRGLKSWDDETPPKILLNSVVDLPKFLQKKE